MMRSPIVIIVCPLLARGCDRLETRRFHHEKPVRHRVPYSLGDAIDWKLDRTEEDAISSLSLLLARGRDRLETWNAVL